MTQKIVKRLKLVTNFKLKRKINSINCYQCNKTLRFPINDNHIVTKNRGKIGNCEINFTLVHARNDYVLLSVSGNGYVLRINQHGRHL